MRNPFAKSELARILGKQPEDWTPKEAGYVAISVVAAMAEGFVQEGWTSENGAMACAALATTFRKALPAMHDESAFMPWEDVKDTLGNVGKRRGW